MKIPTAMDPDMTFDTRYRLAPEHIVQSGICLHPSTAWRPDEGLAMWVADMEFRPPQVVQTALEKMLAHGVYGYFGDDRAYLDAIRWWMKTRHGWEVRRNGSSPPMVW
jgi:cystathionine beta-lyase